jgi:hypothetical protein
MTMFSRFTGAGVASLLLLAAGPAFAEDAHHPGGAQSAAPQAAAPSAQPHAASPAPEAQRGKAAPGGMGMMGAGSGMMGPAMAQMMSPERIEGRLAFIKTELKITDAQLPLWSALAEVLRANARAMKGNMDDMMSGPDGTGRPLPQRIEHHERMMTGHLDALRRFKAVLAPLYAALDDTQKRGADQLLMPRMMGAM